jgi:hypothetical protein
VNEALTIVAFGNPKFGRLGRLNASNRNWRRWPSIGMGTFFMAEKSQFTCTGAMILLRAEFPYVYGGGSAKAAGLKYCWGSWNL